MNGVSGDAVTSCLWGIRNQSLNYAIPVVVQNQPRKTCQFSICLFFPAFSRICYSQVFKICGVGKCAAWRILFRVIDSQVMLEIGWKTDGLASRALRRCSACVKSLEKKGSFEFWCKQEICKLVENLGTLHPEPVSEASLPRNQPPVLKRVQ